MIKRDINSLDQETQTTSPWSTFDVQDSCIQYVPQVFSLLLNPALNQFDLLDFGSAFNVI